jgi:hypothetical protein
MLLALNEGKPAAALQTLWQPELVLTESVRQQSGG